MRVRLLQRRSHRRNVMGNEMEAKIEELGVPGRVLLPPPLAGSLTRSAGGRGGASGTAPRTSWWTFRQVCPHLHLQEPQESQSQSQSGFRIQDFLSQSHSGSRVFNHNHNQIWDSGFLITIRFRICFIIVVYYVCKYLEFGAKKKISTIYKQLHSMLKIYACAFKIQYVWSDILELGLDWSLFLPQ